MSDNLKPEWKVFCQNYIYDWNGTRAYMAAYPTCKPESARSSAPDLLAKDSIQAYIKELQEDLEKVAGLSRLRVLQEHQKLAFSSIAHLHNSWIERKEFDQLTDEQKDCIAEISTQIKRYEPKYADAYDVEFVKIKLYDKQKSLDSISKMLGYDAPTKMEHSGGVITSYEVVPASEYKKTNPD